jgi:outer membrane lipoprotein-sorting protein
MYNPAMKKILYTLFALWLSIAAAHAQNADALIKSFTQKINSHKSMEMDFKLTFANTLQGAFQNFEGTLLCKGNKYRLLTEEFDIYSDGRNKWMCNKVNNEVIIQYVTTDEETADITDNPLRFITSYRKDFKYKIKNTRTENEKTLVDIEFVSNDKKAAYSSIILTIDSGTAYPQAIQYNTPEGNNYTIRITRITPEVEVFDGYFAFPKHMYPGIEIIDLR